jgi:toxin ParE1/3/4
VKLVFSPAAILDLQSISDYTFHHWGMEQEVIYLGKLWRKLEEIRIHPEIHPLRNDLTINCRSARHGKHVIFFALADDRIQVIRILHGAMDFDSHLPDNFI